MSNDNFKNSMVHLLLRNEKEFANKIYLRQPKDGVWHEFSWAQVMLQARKVAGFLHHLGLKRGSHVSIISKNCAEWFIVDFGICLAGMVNVPLFTNQHVESIHYVLEHADIELVFIGKLDDHQRVRGYIPDQYPTISLDYHLDMKVDHTWAEVMQNHIQVEIHEPNPDDLYTIIYTSGTSGTPKGAMFTHQSIANFLSVTPIDVPKINDLPFYRFISYLPLAHVYERSTILLSSLTLNSDVCFVESLDKFAHNLQEIEPIFFTAVPRIWGVFQQKIEQKISPTMLNLLLKIPIVSSLIKKKIKHQLGLTKMTNCFSGASQLPLSVMEFFEKLGIIIQEGYGQTENLAYATVSLLHNRRKGYVGTPRTLVEIKKGEEDELLLKSPCLMSGYYKEIEASKAALTSDGWLHTGDIVEIDAENRVKIVGRLSENFKNQSGEFVVPAPIEKLFSANPMIENLCLVGRNMVSNVLVITLNDETKLKQSKEEINASLQSDLKRINSGLAKYERISHIIIAKDPWTTINDLLTPTLKVKRKTLEKTYEDLIQKSLKASRAIVWE